MPKDLFFTLPEDKQERILDAAYDEFVQYKDNYEKASVKRIAKNADIAIGSIYKYFHDKDDIFFYLLARSTPEPDFSASGMSLLARMQQIASHYHTDTRQQNLAYILSHNIDNFLFSSVKYIIPQMLDSIRSILESEKSQGKLRDSIDVDQAAFLFLIMDSISSIYKKSQERDDLDALDLSKSFLDMMLYGIYK